MYIYSSQFNDSGEAGGLAALPSAEWEEGNKGGEVLSRHQVSLLYSACIVPIVHITSTIVYSPEGTLDRDSFLRGEWGGVWSAGRSAATGVSTVIVVYIYQFLQSLCTCCF